MPQTPDSHFVFKYLSIPPTGSFSFRFFFGCGWFGLLPLAASLLAASAAASAAAALTLASVFAVFRVGIASCS